jgi:glycosyltransferase involved in cell wall biosynthesis
MMWIFWLSLGFLVYTLVGYPSLLWIISLMRRQTHRREAIFPPVTVIVAAHNEAASIGGKIENTLEFDYPRDRLEIIVASDASTDTTAEIIRSFAHEGVRLVESKERRGKHHLQMMACDIARGEILVFTDATIRADALALRKMVSHFADPKIGAVCSVDEFVDTKKSWAGERLYTSGETLLRRMEAQITSLVTLSGSLFAVRREICNAWHPDQSSDFFLALHTVERGYRAALDPECKARLGSVRSERAELSRKVRTIVHGLVVFFAHLKLLNAYRYGFFSWQFLSHKLFRWLLPYATVALLISNLGLWNAGLFYRVMLILQLAGYAAGTASVAGGPLGRVKVLRPAGFFVLGSLATLYAWWKFCLGDKLVTWEPSRRG